MFAQSSIPSEPHRALADCVQPLSRSRYASAPWCRRFPWRGSTTARAVVISMFARWSMPSEQYRALAGCVKPLSPRRRACAPWCRRFPWRGSTTARAVVISMFARWSMPPYSIERLPAVCNRCRGRATLVRLGDRCIRARIEILCLLAAVAVELDF